MSIVELRDRPRTSLAESVRRLSTLVSPYTGIVRSVEELLSAADEPRLIKIGCEPTEGSHLLGAGLDHLEGSGGGSHASRDAAVAAAIGEVAERYAAAYVPEGELVLAAAAELGPACIDPERFALFSAEQHSEPGFAFLPFTRATRVRWSLGFSLPEGRPAYLPAQLVYLSDELARGETRIGYSTSSGLACGASREEAALNALLELVERDAFVLTWSNRLSLPRLEWSGDAELVDLERRYFAATGSRYAVVDLSVFLRVPTALAVVHGEDSDGAALGVGAGSGPTIGEAWLKALSEAYAVRGWARTMRLTEPDRSFRPDFADVETFADHIRLYAHPGHAPQAAFLDGSPQVRDVREIPPLEGGRPLAWIAAIAQRLQGVGASAYAVDVTSPDIRQAGLHVVKVISPELCQLDVAFRARFLGGRRLYRAAYDLGLRPAPLPPGDVNPYPHPFP